MPVDALGGRQPISVALCTYNGAAYLTEQLQSILRQTYPVAQIVVVDDGSTDDTISILRAFGEQHPLIELHQNETRLGAIKNFEKALALTRYAIIAIADQDDVWHPQKIEKMMAAWLPSSPLVYCNSVRFSGVPDFNLLHNPRYARFHGSDGKKLMMFNTVSGHALMVRRQLLQGALPFEGEVMYDWWLAMVAAYNGGVTYVPEVLVLQRAHQTNLTVNEAFSHRTAEGRKRYKSILRPHLQQFRCTPGMPQNDKLVAERLWRLFTESEKLGWSPQLFFFLFQHRQPCDAFERKHRGPHPAQVY